MTIPKPVVLIILDGWGLAPEGPGNAVALAKTPNIDRYWKVYPHTQLAASGEAVGLPRGEEGNSETGHLNLGAGQIVYQDLPRINMSIADDSFYQIQAFKAAANHIKKNNSNLHFLGLVGAGGVHSSINHLFALLQFALSEGLKQVFLHLFTDGRDSPPTSATTYISQIESQLQKNRLGKIATLCGRYYAMDRDNRWERTKEAYEMMVMGKGESFSSPLEALKKSYEAGITDEFIKPVVIAGEDQKPIGLISDHDAVVFYNFRIDRPRQLTKAFILPYFETLVIKKAAFDPYAERYGLRLYEVPEGTTTFKREKILSDIFFVTMTEYEKGLPAQVAFPPAIVKMPLARVLAEKNLRQFHLAETEKERFVTYYFNGQREDPFPGEDRIEIPSPDVPTYDQKPEMSAYEVTEELLKRIKTNMYDFILVNYANPDIVGHTGDLEAGIRACEVTDECVARVATTTINIGGVAVITADHGNVEEMINLKTGEVDTEHSVNPVPFILIDKRYDHRGRALNRGILADVAPTVLSLMEIEKPELMSGRSFV